MGLYTLEMEINVFTLVDVFSIATAVMLGVLFLTVKSENRRANIFISLFLICLSCEVLSVLMESITENEIRLVQSSLFTMPFLLLYSKQTINSPIRYYYYLLFLPGIIFNIIGETIILVEYCFNIFILLYINNFLKKHKQRVENYYSNLELLSLKWMRVIVFIFLGFHALWIIEDLIVIQLHWLDPYFAGLSSFLTLFMIFWIGHNGFSQPEIFKKKLFANNMRKNVVSDESKGEDKDYEHWIKLNDLIQTERLFTDPKLNLGLLSEYVGLNEKEVSRLINKEGHCNFYQLINRYRVGEFKRLLLSNKAKKLSFVGLAEESGFNSKSTFYSAFKALEGQTPKQYYESLR